MIIDFLIKRLWKDSIRNILFCIILFYPLIEIIFYLKDIPLGEKVYYPDYSFFLMCNTAGTGHHCERRSSRSLQTIRNP